MDSSSLHNLLSRNLSGVYRDPQRIHRDTETLLKSPLGRHLRPTTQPLTSNDGSVTPSVLMLHGTLPMTYRNVTYNVPIDLYLPPPYPQRPPTVYVRPVSNMAIKENHRHVGMDGRVYMQYLHDWRAQTHDLRELAVWMSSLFGSEPPCYAKPAGASNIVNASSNVATSASSYGSSSSHRPPAYAQATQSTRNSYNPYTASTTTNSNINSNNRSREAEEQEQKRQQQIEKEIAEANLVAKIAREGSLKEAQLKEEQSRLQKDHEQKLSSMRAMATSKVQYELQVVFRDAKDDLRVTLKNQKLLDYGEDEIQQLLKEGEERKEELMVLNDEMDGAVKMLEDWLETADKQQQQGGDNGNNNSSSPQSSKVDLIALPTDTYSSQMLQLAAENAAIDDCIYFLDQSMARGNIPLDVFLKEVRRLSKRQFMVKAHLIKISQAKALTSGGQRR